MSKCNTTPKHDLLIPNPCRHKECKSLGHQDVSLPTASVILTFCNESASALIRTVWSVINQTPKRLLHEIVLIDDGSQNEEIKDLLPLYVEYRLNRYNG